MRRRVKRFPTTANVIRKKKRKAELKAAHLKADQEEAKRRGITVEALRWERIKLWCGMLTALKAKEQEAIRQARLLEQQRRSQRSSSWW